MPAAGCWASADTRLPEVPHVHRPARPALDPDKLNAFVFRAVEEVGATLNAALVVMGDKLGLYRALAGAGPLDPAELAARPAPRSATSASG